MGEEKRDLGEEIAGKILTAALVVGGVYAVFRLAVRGIFSLMMGGNQDNGIYVLFYGGLAALSVIAVLGIGAGVALFGRTRAKPGGKEQPSVAGSGVNIGLLVVALVAAFILFGFFRGF